MNRIILCILHFTVNKSMTLTLYTMQRLQDVHIVLTGLRLRCSHTAMSQNQTQWQSCKCSYFHWPVKSNCPQIFLNGVHSSAVAGDESILESLHSPTVDLGCDVPR